MKGHIKTFLREVITKAKNTFIVGSITDGYYKLQVQITDHYDSDTLSKLQRWMHILITGRMKIPANGIPVLTVSTIHDVAFLNKDSSMSFLLTLNGYRSIRNHN